MYLLVDKNKSEPDSGGDQYSAGLTCQHHGSEGNHVWFQIYGTDTDFFSWYTLSHN